MSLVGKVHSRESFGTVDGPGIRYVLFLQGCPMRCIYCHNPDTWNVHGGYEMTADEVIKEYEKNRAFYSRGGITVTGGEPLLQLDFLTELFTLAKARGIHTAIDTSGITFSEKEEYLLRLDKLLALTDLVMLDIKHIDSEMHEKLTGRPNERIIAFARYLEKKNIPLWVRHVIIEGYTTEPDGLRKLGRFIGALKNLKALDVLPYHDMGKAKYKELGIPYPLRDMPSLERSEALKAKGYILEGIGEVRTKKKKT